MKKATRKDITAAVIKRKKACPFWVEQDRVKQWAFFIILKEKAGIRNPRKPRIPVGFRSRISMIMILFCGLMTKMGVSDI